MLQFPWYLDELNRLTGIRAGWFGRVPGLPVLCDREEAMSRLRPIHEGAVVDFAGGDRGILTSWRRAEQVHGCEVRLVPGAATIDDADGLAMVAGADGLVCRDDGNVLAIYVADCGAIWLADRKTRAIGLLHSGRKGTEADILGKAVELMVSECGTDPADLLAVLGPCIRPPDYEVDFAAEIGRQAVRAGIGKFIDSGENTAEHPGEYYSYRKESGRTGRMMALLYRETL